LIKKKPYLSHHYSIYGEQKYSSNGSVVNFMLQPLYTRKITPVPIDEAGWDPAPV
jgi:hypothetical protein